MITNTTDHPLTLEDFVKENPHLVKRYNDYYESDEGFTQEMMIIDAIRRGMTFMPHEKTVAIFGDSQGDTLGWVFDYMLRDGGKSKSFRWKFKELLR